MKRRLLLRLFIGAVLLNLIIVIYHVLRRIHFPRDLQTKKWSDSIQSAIEINSDHHGGESNHSGVAHERTRTIVMAKLHHEDTSWVEKELPEWQRAIYTVDDRSAPLHTARNKGREANAYLKYLIDNYHSLPDFMVFLHSHRDGPDRAWHNDNDAYDNVISAKALRLDFVQRNGYANLRCSHEPGCPNGLVLHQRPLNQDQSLEQVFPDAWLEMMGEDATLPQTIGVAYGSQFAITREQVLKRPQRDYERFHAWLIETKLDDALSAQVMGFMWHLIFGQRPVYCPDVSKCFCDVYGVCAEQIL